MKQTTRIYLGTTALSQDCHLQAQIGGSGGLTTVLSSQFPLLLGYSYSIGLPAKARVEPPSNNHFPNPNRPSNPFTPSPEPDWIDVKHMPSSRRPEPPPARGSQRARTVDFDSPSTSLPPTQKPAARKMIAPLYPGHATQILSSDGARDSLNDLRRSGSSASTHSLPSLPYRASNMAPQTHTTNKPQVLRKPAPPPIPNKKPSLLSKGSSSGPSYAPPPQRYRDDPPEEESRAHAPPPARRSMAAPPNLTRKPVQNLIDDDGEKPALPPRTGSGGGGRSLMDDEPEDVRSMGEWEVLRPGR
jgi:inositol-1,4,5-trisphosphate 5-phosphatase